MSENPLHAIFQVFEGISHCVQTHLSQLGGLATKQSPTNGRPIFSLSSPFKANQLISANATPTIVQPKEIPNEVLSSSFLQGKSATPVTKEELGRATWTFLHTLAAQYPDNPTRQQKKDVKQLMDILSRMYPCKECADHFKEILRFENFVLPLTLSSEINVAAFVMESKRRTELRKKTEMLVLKVHFPCTTSLIDGQFHMFDRVNPVQAGSQAEFSQWLCHAHNVVNRSLGKVVFPCERVDARWGKLECEQRACDLQGTSTTNFW
ncbi:hypothetical protein C3L33_20993, partial [Rhododendron williamsianum]